MGVAWLGTHPATPQGLEGLHSTDKTMGALEGLVLSWGGHSALTPRPGSCNFGKRTASSHVWYPPWPGLGQVGLASTKSWPGLPAATDLKRPPGPPAAESTQPAWCREDAPGGAGSSQSLSPMVSRTNTTKQRQTKKRTDGLGIQTVVPAGGAAGPRSVSGSAFTLQIHPPGHVWAVLLFLSALRF